MLESQDVGVEIPKELASHPQWQLVQRIVASPALVRSRRLRSFLVYVARSALLDRADHVTEQQIGVHVFGRPADYNASEDNIVRSHARFLRTKLAEYFQSESGRAEPIILTIPKGCYLPQFHRREVELAPPAAPNRRWKAAAIAGVLVCASIAAGTLMYLRLGSRASNARPSFLAAILDGRRPTTLVVSDYVYMTVQEASGQAITLDEYVSPDYYRRIEELNVVSGLARLIPNIRHRHYTGFENVTVVKRLTAVASGTPLVVRFARDLTMREIEGVNLILLGSRQSNPWVYLFEPKMNFRFVYNASSRDITVENRQPRPGEPGVYRSDPEGTASRVIYGGMALLPGLHRGNRVLILQGTAMAGVEAAIGMLENEALLRELEDCAGPHRDRYFEALIRIRTVNTVSGETSIAGCRHPMATEERN